MKHFISAVLVAGLLAGMLDIVAAMVWSYVAFGSTPVRVLQYIASGWLGMNSFAGGTQSTLLGLVIHFVIAFCWTMFFFMVYPLLKSLLRSTAVSAIFLGLFIWVMMNLVVLPMTRVPKGPVTAKSAAIGCLILILAIGVPVSIAVKKYYSRN